ncbi:MAG: [FeFe] hydrogenase H-cluster maturation GTPase HydF [Bacteroidetes bacterium]|nr:[FeFe] hydrogenase H-cluster maturation GTPase HydF [Bacteroidota bacterium]
MKRGRDTKPHIGIFGRRNVGKSSLINILAGHEVAIVSEIAGTTTDPVKKSIEIPQLGPVILIDTAGIDDTGELGEKRISKTKEAMSQVDLALMLFAHNTFNDDEKELIRDFQKAGLPYVIIHNKSDEEKLDNNLGRVLEERYNAPLLDFSSVIPVNPDDLIRIIRETMPESAYTKRPLVGDLISYGDTVLLITPIDIEAPEGRMILPQVQVIRDVLDNDGVCVVCKEREVDTFIKKMQPKPVLAITDSQVFPKADAAIPKEIPLTSFSIVLARQKGDFENYLKGTPKISELKSGDRVLILESCTHHVSCDDIGRVKIPRWLSNFTGKDLSFDIVSGLGALSRPVTDYAMVIQCGGCMITRKQLLNRLKPALDAGIPVTNYGMAIAWVHGIYHRAIAPFTGKAGDKGEYL